MADECGSDTKSRELELEMKLIRGVGSTCGEIATVRRVKLYNGYNGWRERRRS